MKDPYQRVTVSRPGQPPWTGEFIQWGNDYEEFEAGPGNFTVAIVRTDGGQIEMPRADWVKFGGC